MERIPFGVRRLDTAIGGGAPPGSVVLLSGEAGAGSREFSYTAAAMSGLSFADSELFTLYYGSEQSMPVEEVHYISLSASERQIRKEMKLVMDDEIVDEGLSPVTFHDLSPEFFRLSPVPREWYADRTIDISQLGESQQRSGIAEALGNRLTRHAPGNLVVIDSLSDLAGTETEDLQWRDVPVLLKGLSRAAEAWGGLLLVHVSKETLSAVEHGRLVDAVDGSFIFEWESGGSDRSRTLVVKQFRGVLSQIESEDIVRFETEIGDTGFDISDIRKIS